MSSSLRRVLVLLLACASTLSGCRVWGVPGTPPAEYLRNHTLNQVRIHRTDGTQLVLLEPEVIGDSLRGYAETTGRPTIALADIDSIAVRRTSWGRTIALVGGVGAAVAVATLLSSCDETRSIC